MNKIRPSGQVQTVDSCRLGNYILGDRLGGGGMGVVYRAQHVHLKSPFAVKVMRAEEVEDSTAAQRFYQEMEATGRVRSEYVVAATDAGIVDGQPYLAMELVEGLNLSDLQKQIPLTAGQACELVRQAALGLAAIENQGLVHRDIKPSNLMLNFRGILKILDLGLARLHHLGDSGLTLAHHVVGTADYVSPEQVTKEGLDIRSDIYSLGCTLFSLLAGRPPYGDTEYDSIASKMMAHVSGPFPALPADRNVPEQVQRIMARMTARRPQDRFQHPIEVAEAIEAHCAPLDFLDRLAALCDQRLTESIIDTATLNVDTTVRTGTSLSRRVVVGTTVGLLVLAAGVAGVWRALITPATHPEVGQPRTTQAESNDAGSRSVPGPETSSASSSTSPVVTPHPVLVPDDAESHWRIDERGELHVHSRGYTLLAIAELDRQTEAIDLVFKQREPSGHVGIFWGYQEPDFREEMGKFHTLFLNRSPASPDTCQIEYAERTFYKDRPGAPNTRRSGLVAKDIPVDPAGIHLRFVFDAETLVSITVGDREVREGLPEVSTGTVGLYQLGSSTLYKSVVVE